MLLGVIWFLVHVNYSVNSDNIEPKKETNNTVIAPGNTGAEMAIATRDVSEAMQMNRIATPLTAFR